MRFIHSADLHIGITSYEKSSYKRIEDWKNAFNILIKYAQQQQIPYVFLVGDLFHKNLPTIEEIVVASECLTELSRHVKSIFLIAGNHDIVSLSVKRHILEAIANIPNVTLLDKTQVYELDCHPFDIAHYHYLDLKPLEYKKDKPHIVTFHGTVEGAQDDLGNLTPHSHLSKDFLLKTNPIYVALGHIHKRQNLNEGGVPVIYSGSLIQTSFSERQIQKGFLDVNIEQNIQTFIPTQYLEYCAIDNIEELKTKNIENKICKLNFQISLKEKELYNNILEKAYYITYGIAKSFNTAKDAQEQTILNEEDVQSLEFEELIKQTFTEEEQKFIAELL